MLTDKPHKESRNGVYLFSVNIKRGLDFYIVFISLWCFQPSLLEKQEQKYHLSQTLYNCRGSTTSRHHILSCLCLFEPDNDHPNTTGIMWSHLQWCHSRCLTANGKRLPWHRMSTCCRTHTQPASFSWRPALQYSKTSVFSGSSGILLKVHRQETRAERERGRRAAQGHRLGVKPVTAAGL